MIENTKTLKLSDLIDIQVLQKFQDTFAEIMDVSCITMDFHGAVTKPSRFTDFCLQYTEGSTLGLNKCVECDIKKGNLAADKKEPIIYTCRAGVTNFAVPIFVDGQHVGSILGGQVFTEPPDEKYFRRIAKHFNMDEDNYINALKQIKVVPVEHVKRAADVLYLVANAISEIGLKNLQLMKLHKIRLLYASIMEAIRGSLDIDITKQKIVNIVGKTLNADRCVIIEYDKVKDDFLPVQDEYLSSDKIISYKGMDINHELPNLSAAVKEGKSIIVKDKKIALDTDGTNFTIDKKTIDKYKVHSAYAVPLYYFGQLLGVLSLHYVSDDNRLGDDEINLVSRIADQVAIAIYQSKLYKKTQINAQREKIIGDIIAKAISTFDTGSIKDIVKEVGVITKADRCFFVEMDLENMKGKPVTEDSEYLVSSDIKSVVGYDLLSEDVGEFISQHLKTKDILFFDFEKLRKKQTKKYAGINRYSKLFNLKSGIGIPFYYKDKLIASLSIEYVKEKVFPSEDELNFLRILANQVGMAFNQVQLYQETKKTAQREALLRNIMEKIRSSLDLGETLSYICTETAKLFNVQRTTIIRFPDSSNYEEFIIMKEYKSAPSIKGLEYSLNLKKTGTYWAQHLLEKNKVFVIDNILEEQVPDYIKQAYNYMGVKSLIGTALRRGENIWGTLTLAEYNVYRHWSEEEKMLLKTIADQVYIAIVQAEIFEKEKQTAQREALLRDITSAISSTLDFNQIRKMIVSKLCISFNADSCIFYLQNQKNQKFQSIDEYSVYSASSEIENPIGVNIIEDYGWGDYFRSGKMIDIAYSNIEDFKKDYNLYGTLGEKFLDKYKIKSFMLIPIVYADIPLGMLGLNFIKHYFQISDDDLMLVRSVATHAGIALHQAELFEKEKQNAEREKIIGNVVTKAISTFDINEIKQIVTEVGLITKADRCYFVEVDLEGMKGKLIDYEGEYLASPDIKSIRDYDFPAEDVKLFVERYLEVRDLMVFDYENIINDESEHYSGIKRYGKTFGLKSGIGIPFIYMDKLTAILAIEYVKEKVFPSEDELEFLRILGKQIGMAFSQIQLYQDTKKTAEKESTLRKTIDILRSTLDTDQIKKRFVEVIMNYFDADRCLFAEIDKETGELGSFKIESLKDPEIQSLIGHETGNEFPEFGERIRRGKNIIIKDLEKLLSRRAFPNYKSLKSISESDVKSDYGLIVWYKNIAMGIIIIHFVSKKRILTNDELDFLKVLRDQVGIALYHAELFQDIKRIAERESLLRNIVEKIRHSLNLEEIKHEIVTQLGKILKADRVTVADYNEQQQNYIITKNSEYRSSANVKTFTDVKFNEIPGFLQKIRNVHMSGKDIIFNDLEQYLDENDLKGTAIEKFYKDYDFISSAAINMYYENVFLGNIVITFGHQKTFSDEEIKFLKTLADQIGVAFHQSQLYEKEKLTAEKESTLRKTIDVLRSTLNPDEIKKRFVDITMNYFDADRCLFDDYDKTTGKFMPFDIERLKSPDIKSLIGVSVEGEFPEFAARLKKWKSIIIKDVEKILSRNDLPNYKAIQTLHKSDAKSDYGLYVRYQNQMMGILIIHYVDKKRVLTFEELDFLKTLTKQAGNALYQAEIYQSMKSTAERETLLRNIIEKIRSSLDIDETLSFICEETAKLFGVQRSTIMVFPDKTNYNVYLVRKEYKSSPNILGFSELTGVPQIADYWGRMLKEHDKIFAVEDIMQSDAPQFFKNSYNGIGVKSVIAAIIGSGKDTWGNLILSEYDNAKHWSEEDRALLKTITNQIYIAINQAELYQNMETKANNEKVLREIMMSSVSNLDIEEVIKSIVSEEGRLFKADRCFFIEIDSRTGLNMPIKKSAEYLSSKEIKSHLVRQPGDDETKDFIKILKRKIITAVDDISKIDLPEVSRKMLVEDLSVKSYLIVPVFYGDTIYGSIVLHYVNNFKHFTQDEIDMAYAIANQAAIVIRQAKLYSNAQKTAERETLLRTIIETLRSSLDITEVKKKITKVLGKAFNADRCYFRAYDKLNDLVLPSETEYLSSPDIKSLVNVESNQKSFKYFLDVVRNREKGFYPIVIDDTVIQDEYLEAYMKAAGIKADYAIPIIDRKEEIVWLILHYVKEDPKLDENSKKLLETIAYQIDIAFEQIGLYNAAQQTAKREILLRKIFETIQNNLDIENIQNVIVEEVGKALEADRCVIIRYDNIIDKFLIVNNEYLSSDKISPYKGVDVNEEVPNFVQAVKAGEIVVINDKEIQMEIDTESFDAERDSIRRHKVKTAYAFPLVYSGELLGVLSLHYVKKQHVATDSEKNMLLIIANQIAIALNRAELYRKLRQTTANQTAILNNMPFMAWLKDKTGTLLAANNEYARMCSTQIQNLIGKTDFDLFPKEQAESYAKEDQIVMETKQTISSVDLISGPEGATWHETFKSPVLDYRGNSVGTAGFSRDITDSKEAQLELLRRQKQISKARERESLLRRIFETMRQSLDVNVIKQTIVNEIGKALNVDICFILLYKSDEDYFYIDEHSEYRSSEEQSSFISFNAQDRSVKWFIDLFHKNEEICFSDVDIFLAENNLVGTPEDAFLKSKEYHIKSSYNLPINYADKLLGYIILEYTNNPVSLDENDLEFIRTISNQAGIAIHQAKLYVKTKKQAERESLLRKITEEIRSSLDIKEIKKNIVNEIGKSLDADGCFFRIWKNYETASLEVTQGVEYFKNAKSSSLADIEPSPEILKQIKFLLENTGQIYFPDIDEELEADPLLSYIKNRGVKSSYVLPVEVKSHKIGYLGVEFDTKKAKLSPEDLDFIRIITYQSGIAFNQAELYSKTKKLAEREALLRKITESIRSSLDINQIKKNIVDETGKTFNADRCIIRLFDDDTHSYVVAEKSAEYLKSTEIISIIEAAPSKEFQNYLISELHKNGQICIPDVDTLPEEHEGAGFLKAIDIQSVYVSPIRKDNELIGFLTIHFTQSKVKLSAEDIELLNTIAFQSEIALNQAELYAISKSQAERETFLKKIIETVGGSLDLETVLNAICKEIFELFKPDRVAIENFPTEGDYLHWTLSTQYTSGPDILGVNDIEYSEESKKYFGTRVLEQGIDIIADDIEQADLPDYFVNTNKSMNIKSFLAVALKKGDDKWGVLALSQVHNYRKWTQDELQLLHTVTDQAYIAIRQAELYTQTKLQAEREKISRNIVEILRSTMDKNMIKHLFVKNIGKYFNADRVFFSEYDPSRKIYLPVDIKSEYLSGPDEKSFVGYDWTDDSVRDYIHPLLEKREVKIFSWEDYIRENQKSQDFISLFVDANVKSSYNFPVLYQERIMGYFCIEFTHEVHKFSNEDINRLRSICTQTGIALYQSELYIKAQESDKTKSEFIANISNMLIEPLNNMIKFSEILPKSELDYEKQQEYLHNISQGGKQLLGLTDELKKLSNTSPFQDKP